MRLNDGFLSVVSDLFYPFWFVGKLIFTPISCLPVQNYFERHLLDGYYCNYGTLYVQTSFLMLSS